MTANAPEQLSHGAASDTGVTEPYLVRLVTKIPEPLDRRLRVLAAMSGRSVTAVLAELLARSLPTAEELADQMRGPGR